MGRQCGWPFVVSLLNYDEGLRASPGGKLMVGLIPILREEPDTPGWQGEDGDVLRLRQLMVLHAAVDFGKSNTITCHRLPFMEWTCIS